LKQKLNGLEVELNEQRELASSRLAEIEKLNIDYQQTLKQNEKLKFDVSLAQVNSPWD
jgi:hypothetical protein